MRHKNRGEEMDNRKSKRKKKREGGGGGKGKQRIRELHSNITALVKGKEKEEPEPVRENVMNETFRKKHYLRSNDFQKRIQDKDIVL